MATKQQELLIEVRSAVNTLILWYDNVSDYMDAMLAIEGVYEVERPNIINIAGTNCIWVKFDPRYLNSDVIREICEILKVEETTRILILGTNLCH